MLTLISPHHAGGNHRNTNIHHFNHCLLYTLVLNTDTSTLTDTGYTLKKDFKESSFEVIIIISLC